MESIHLSPFRLRILSAGLETPKRDACSGNKRSASQVTFMGASESYVGAYDGSTRASIEEIGSFARPEFYLKGGRFRLWENKKLHALERTYTFATRVVPRHLRTNPA